MFKIHVNKQTILTNNKYNKNDPPVTIRRGSKSWYAHSVEIQGPSKVIYNPITPLKCGAKVWIECEGKILLHRNTPDNSYGSMYLTESGDKVLEG